MARLRWPHTPTAWISFWMDQAEIPARSPGCATFKVVAISFDVEPASRVNPAV